MEKTAKIRWVLPMTFIIIAPFASMPTRNAQRIAAIATLNDHMVQFQRQALEATVRATQHQVLQKQQIQSQRSAHSGDLPSTPDDSSPTLPEARPRVSDSSDSISSPPAPHRRLGVRDRNRERELTGSLPSPPISYLRSPSPSRKGAAHAEAGTSALQKRKRPETSSPSEDNTNLQGHPVDDAKMQRCMVITASSSPSPRLPSIVANSGE